MKLIVSVALVAVLSNSTFSAPGAGIVADQVEGCECDLYCPCVFQKDAVFDDCRVLLGWRVREGKWGETDLTGQVFAASITKSGKNIEKVMGKWEGILFLSEKASDAQKGAIQEMLKRDLGPAFAKLEIRTSPVEWKGEEGSIELTVGKIGTLKTSPLKGPNGQVTTIENAPSPIALPKTFCARADVNLYDDGTTKWDFAGRNSFYGTQTFKGK